MPKVKHVSAKNGDVSSWWGTMKGAFVLRPTNRAKMGHRRTYSIGAPVYAMAFDQRTGPGRRCGGPSRAFSGHRAVLRRRLWQDVTEQPLIRLNFLWNPT